MFVEELQKNILNSWMQRVNYSSVKVVDFTLSYLCSPADPLLGQARRLNHRLRLQRKLQRFHDSFRLCRCGTSLVHFWYHNLETVTLSLTQTENKNSCTAGMRHRKHKSSNTVRNWSWEANSLNYAENQRMLLSCQHYYQIHLGHILEVIN